MKRKLIPLLVVVLLLTSIAPIIAYAEPASDVACLMYADAAWGEGQYFNDGKTYLPTATNATVTGPGKYTVGLDFTGITGGAASGLSFAGVQILNGNINFPGYCITILDIKVNGESIKFDKGYTSSDNEKETRMNIYNTWADPAKLPEDARSSDYVLADAKPVIVDPALFASVKTMEVTFDYSKPEPEAYIMYADPAWGECQYFNNFKDAATVKATDAVVTGEGSYKIGLDFTGTANGAATDLAFAAVGIKGGELLFPDYSIRIDSMKVNGADVTFTKGYTSSDNDVETRMNIFNEWTGGTLPDNARSFDNNLDGATSVIVDKAAFASVKTFEIEFTFISGGAPAVTAEPEFNAEEALAKTYNAYFGIQTEKYIFRNAWIEKNYGMKTPNWTHLTGWDADNMQVDYGGTFTDAVIDGNGTYTVGVTLGEMGLGMDTTMRMLFVSTDIPGKLFDDGLVTISDVKTVIDGGPAKDKFTVNTDTEGDYLQIEILNEYNPAVGAEAIPYTMPTKDITITFTISGLKESSAPVEEPTVAPEVTETASSSFLSSPGAIAAFAGGLVVVIGGIIAIIVVLSKKKKTN